MKLRFSQRSTFSCTENPIAQALARLRAQGKEMLDLTVSNPTEVELAYPNAALQQALYDVPIHPYEPHPLGILSARQVLAQTNLATGIAIDPNHILLTSSTSEAYSYLFKLLCEPGDEVLVPQPSYPLLEILAQLESIKLVPYALRYDGQWHVDHESLIHARTSKTKAVIVIHPNNPTGSYLKQPDFDAIVDLKLPIISDEVFSDFAWTHNLERVASCLTATQGLVFTLHGLSKSLGLPQMKLAWTCVAGAADLVEQAIAKLEMIADTFLSPNTLVQRALPTWLSFKPAIQSQILERVLANHQTLIQAQSPNAPWTVLHAEGGWNAVLRIPHTHSEEEWVLRLLHEAQVHVHPGYFYDFQAGAHLVISLLSQPKRFDLGIEKLVGLLGQ